MEPLTRGIQAGNRRLARRRIGNHKRARSVGEISPGTRSFCSSIFALAIDFRAPSFPLLFEEKIRRKNAESVERQ
jgi:hypothetical protein